MSYTQRCRASVCRFMGAHCDVGGGYPDRRLSDLALGRMQDQASAMNL